MEVYSRGLPCCSWGEMSVSDRCDTSPGELIPSEHTGIFPQEQSVVDLVSKKEASCKMLDFTSLSAVGTVFERIQSLQGQRNRKCPHDIDQVRI